MNADMSHVQFLFVLLVVVTGCEDGRVPGPSKEASSVSQLSQSPVGDIQPPTDGSLALDAYIQDGMPAHDRSWSGADMVRTASVLNTIAQKDAGHLPRYQSPRSGELFKRITSNDNLVLHRNRQLLVEQRLPDAMDYMKSHNQTLKIYLEAFIKHQVADSELVELMSSQLDVAVVMIQLVDEFLPTLDKNDRTYPVRMKGLAQLKHGMAGIVAGTMQTLTESHAYRSAELKRLVNQMRRTFPEILPAIPEGSRSEALVRLRSFLDDPKMQHLKPELSDLVIAVEMSVNADKAL